MVLPSIRAAKPYLLLAPLLLLLAAGVVLPLTIFIVQAFWLKVGGDISHGFTTENFEQLLKREVYLWLILKALIYGAIASVVTLVLAYPLAYISASRATRYKAYVLLAVLIPLYTSDVVRIFAWRSVLGGNGLLNSLLIWAGVIEEPIGWLLFSPFAAILSLCHMLFPFMFLAIWAGLELLDRTLIESARDLGARPWRVFTRIVLPLSLPGVFAGMFFVFIPVAGDYVYVNLMGGTGGVTISKAIVQMFGAANNWPFGSAMAAAFMLGMAGLLTVLVLVAMRVPSVRALARR